MNRIYLVIGVGTMLISMLACKEEASYMPQIEQMRDSVFNAYPTVGAITIEVKHQTDIRVVIGDVSLYDAAADVKQKEANELGLMAARIFGSGNELRNGTLVITKNLKNSSANPPDGIAIPIRIDSLKQAINK